MVAWFSYTSIVLAVALAACSPTTSPALSVVGIHENASREVVFVQVTNPARQPMRITKLQYTFAAEGRTTYAGEVRLSREIQPGGAAVVEVPFDGGEPDVLTGELTAELEQVTRRFHVSTQIPATR